jgi:hypothetical protein
MSKLSPAIPGQVEYFTFGLCEKLGESDLRFYLQNLVIASLPKEFTSTSLETIFSCGVVSEIAAVVFVLLLLTVHVPLSDGDEVLFTADEERG